MSISYVTAFLDIGRDDWKNEEFGRKYIEYENAFLNFFNFFVKNNVDSYLIIFLDKKRKDNIERKINNFSYIKLILIDEDYLYQYSTLWNRLDLETEIINSIDFKNKIKGREKCPETKFPKYTLINHAKIDFIDLAFNIFSSNFYCWFDYGYFCDDKRLPNNLLDINKLDKEMINYVSINPIDSFDFNIEYTLKYAPEKVCGGFFFGRKEKLIEYRKLYHKVHKELQEKWIVDDDQHMIIKCYEKSPDLFKIHNVGDWNEFFIYFEK